MTKNPLSYTGINEREQPKFISAQRNPTSNDNLVSGTEWENTETNVIYKTTGSGSWVSITTSDSGTVWSDIGVSQTVAANACYVSTAAITLTLPLSPSNGDTSDFVVGVASNLNITANTGDTIRIGNSVTATAGTVSSAVLGSSLKLVYNSTLNSWLATAVVGNWSVV